MAAAARAEAWGVVTVEVTKEEARAAAEAVLYWAGRAEGLEAAVGRAAVTTAVGVQVEGKGAARAAARGVATVEVKVVVKVVAMVEAEKVAAV